MIVAKPEKKIYSVGIKDNQTVEKETGAVLKGKLKKIQKSPTKSDRILC